MPRTRAAHSAPQLMPPLLRTLRLRDLFLLFIGSVIGSGIFLTPGLILRQLNGSVGFSLLVWIAGGTLSFLGALTPPRRPYPPPGPPPPIPKLAASIVSSATDSAASPLFFTAGVCSSSSPAAPSLPWPALSRNTSPKSFLSPPPGRPSCPLS